MKSDIITTIDGRNIVWRDKTGMLHFCEGADVHPGVRLLWTRCERHDVPANCGWLQVEEDHVDCRKCIGGAP